MNYIGVDENNLSPSIAGPVVVTALFPKKEVAGVTDSKLLSHAQRLSLLGPLQDNSIYSMSLGTLPMIALVGVQRSRNIAIVQCLTGLIETLGYPEVSNCTILLDGSWSKKQLEYFRRALSLDNIVPGKDEEDYAVAAASIVGKVYIDSMFRGFGDFYKIYGANFNKGGVSSEHRDALREHGPSAFHRPRNYGAKWWHSILGGTEFDQS